MKRNRTTLKGYFRKGLIPGEAHFADLIDSMLNQEDDNLNKPDNDPLRIAASGADESLLNFFRVGQNEERLSWQVKQKPGGKSGLSIGDESGSRLFIESGTGQVGIGTTTPGAKLDVNGNGNLGGALTVNGALTVGSIQLSGFSSAEADEWPNFVWHRDASANWDEGLLKHGPAKGKFARAGFGIHLHQSREFGFFATNWDALFAVAGQSGDAFIKGKLELGGDLTVRGNAVSTGSVYAGGNPVVYENFEISLRGSAFDSSDGNNTYLKIANISMNMETGRGINTVILNPNGTFKAGSTHDVYANPGRWNDWAGWVNDNAASGDIVAAASYDALGNAPRGGAAEALLRNVEASEAFSAVKGHPRSPYALLFIRGGKAVEVSVAYTGLNAQIRTTYYNLLNNTGFMFRNPLYQRMYPDNPLVYQDIFEAKEAGAIARLGKPPYDEKTYTSKNPWNDRTIIRFGGNDDPDGNGALVTIPTGYDTVWLRVLGDRWNVMKAYFTDGQNEQVGLWAGGWRVSNCYSPDGSLSDSYKGIHQWLAIPAGRSGTLALISKAKTDKDFWLSGLAFSRNPWSHAAQSAVGIHWASNGGKATAWADGWHSWNGDVLSKINPKTNLELMIPVLPSGRDKLLYLVEHNNNWNGAMHAGISVNDQSVERFTATYENPFARHWNSKFYNRYIAARVPAALIPGDKRYLSVRIDMMKQDEGIHFREIGTHDLDVPLR